MGVKWIGRWLGKGLQGAVSEAPRVVVLPSGRVTIARTLDCLGAACPRPQLLTLKVMGQLQEGEVVELLSDNPATVETLPALMFTLCGTHLATVKEEDCWRVYMRKGI